jgi:hypothetical protein
MKPKLLLCLALVLSGNCHAAIVYPKAPDGGRQIVIENVGEFLPAGLRVEELTIGEPYESYYVGPTNLASGKFLSAAKSRSGHWTYLIMHGTNDFGAMALMADEKYGNKLEFASFAESAKQILQALKMAEQLPQIKKQDYEFRLLWCSSILFEAVWLHGKSDDIIIPLGATFGRWNALQPYSESQMVKLLKPEAKKKLKEPPGMID